MHKIEAEINDMIKNNYDQLTTPHMCVIIFEEEEGPQMALGSKNGKRDPEKSTLLDQPLFFKKAQAPTDIIWENKGTKFFWRKHLKAALGILLLLLASFIVVYEISTWEQSIQDMFPNVDCKFVSEMYGSKLKKFAVEDFIKIDVENSKQSHGAY